MPPIRLPVIRRRNRPATNGKPCCVFCQDSNCQKSSCESCARFRGQAVDRAESQAAQRQARSVQHEARNASWHSRTRQSTTTPAETRIAGRRIQLKETTRRKEPG